MQAPNRLPDIFFFCEALERRVLLSSVEVIGAGVTGNESIQLQVNGQVVATYDNLGTGAYNGQYVSNVYNTSQQIAADDVRIQFTNDLFDAQNGIDRNVRIDAILIDGVRYETEASNVFSTGTWLPADGIQPGFRESEFLHTNGYFQFASSTNDGSVVEVRAFGTEGTEQFALQIGGQSVAQFSAGTSNQVFRYQAAGTVSPDDVRIEFLNDQYDPANGIDTNLIVDYVSIDGTLYQTESPNVFSTGTWTSADGIQPGFRQSETLHTNGYFQYASSSSGSSIIVNARGTEGFERFQLQVDGQVIAESTVGTSNSSFAFQAAETVTADQIRVAFINDQYDPGNGIDTNLIVDNIVVDGQTFQTEAANVFSTGTWVEGIGIQPGYRQSEVLHSNGYFAYSTTPRNPGTIALSTAAVSFAEDIGQVGVAVFRTGGSDGRVTVDYTTVTGTAGASDFQAISGTLVFEDGETDQLLTISITDDAISESDESFEIRLSNPTGGASLGLATEQLTIQDDDLSITGYLPDMVVIGSTLGERLSIDLNEQPGRELLRFSTEVANVGDGPLEIYGGSTSGDSQDVYQRIYQSGGFQDVLAGEFVFHPEHGHVHFEGFARYDLINDNGQIVASGGKTSFCLVNIRQPFPNISSSASMTHGRGGNSCGQVQGISAGYSDVYGASLPDQWIDITNVADGDYWLDVTADPDNSLVEENESNNSDRIRIRLSNGTVRQI